MRQQILTKFVALWHILKHFVVDDVSRVILKSYIDLLLEYINWYEICVWFSEIKWFGLDSPYKFSPMMRFIYNGKKSDKLVYINPDFGKNNYSEIATILGLDKDIFSCSFEITLVIDKMGKWMYRLRVEYVKTILQPKMTVMTYGIDTIEKIVDYLKIKN